MKKFKNIRKSLLCMLIAGMLTFTLSLNVAAQDSAKTGSKKGVVVLKIKKDDNGKTTVIDTTFTISTPAGQKELDEFLKKHEEELGKLSDKLENIEVLVDIPDFPDSMDADSVFKHMKYICKDVRSPHFRCHNKPGGFGYDFDVQCPPDAPFPDCEGFEGENQCCHDVKIFRGDDTRPTLSDIIGDIPMDRVKNYSIKDRKNGKRIIIDIEDAPLTGSPERVVIIREPGKQQRKSVYPDRQMKVIINSDEGRQHEN
jgi:hypothetical protein